MNSYGQPNGPEVAMLGELHRLWGRVFGDSDGHERPGTPLARAALVLALVFGVGAVVWVLV